MEDPTRILIIDTAWLGDAVLTTSLIGSVRTLWPASKLHVLVSPRGEAVLRGQPAIDDLWVFDKRGKDRGLLGLLKMASRLRKTGFGLILNAHPSFRSRLLTGLTGAPVRVGYGGFGASLCFTHHIPYDPASEPDHIGRRHSLLTALPSSFILHPSSFIPPPYIAILPEEAAWSETFVRERSVENPAEQGRRPCRNPLLGLIPGTAWETKRWPLENFIALALRWITERDGFVLIFGGMAERGLIEPLCAANPARIIPVIAEPLPRVAALLHRCEAVVGGDTGVMFLAAAVQKPRVLALHGCTQPNHPFIPPSRAITAGVPCCIPVFGHGAHRCKWAAEPWCMAQISVERVWEELRD